MSHWLHELYWVGAILFVVGITFVGIGISEFWHWLKDEGN